jgi:transcriptional regulator with XRE-family HTH domain
MIITDKCILNPQKLGQRVRQARERQGLSQEELAAEMGLGQRAISELENGKRRLSVTEVPDLARVLDVPFLYFFGDDLTPDDLDMALLAQFHQLPSVDVQKTLIEIARLLVKTMKA